MVVIIHKVVDAFKWNFIELPELHSTSQSLLHICHIIAVPNPHQIQIINLDNTLQCSNIHVSFE